MRLRSFTLGAAVAMAAAGLFPATAMASSPPPVLSTGPGPTADAGASAGSAASASSRNNVNVSVVTQLPRGYNWDNSRLYDGGRPVALPAGYTYADGGVMGPNDHFYFAPAGRSEGVVIAPMTCHGGKYEYNKAPSGNWLGDVVDKALKACAGVYDAAYGLISDAFGSGSSSGYGSSASGC